MWSEYTYKYIKKILFTMFCLIVYRIGVAIPIPGINVKLIHHFFYTHQHTNGILNFLDIFSGGALNRMSIFSLGIVPYINSSIVINLIQGAHIFPYLDKLSLDGAQGRRRINQIIKFFTLALGVIQSLILILALNNIPAMTGIAVVKHATLAWSVLTTITLVTGV
ncbi:MAG: hypothetical protein LBM05_01170, partial [Endomicrobium sp.]|nr:hypothetical protein [Endomicrobium sp.]